MTQPTHMKIGNGVVEMTPADRHANSFQDGERVRFRSKWAASRDWQTGVVDFVWLCQDEVTVRVNAESGVFHVIPALGDEIEHGGPTP